MIKQYLGENHATGSIWGINENGIDTKIRRLSRETGIKFSCHSFRRGFACNLHRKGLSTLDIMHLGGWPDLSMVLNTQEVLLLRTFWSTIRRSVTFQDSMRFYETPLG